VKDSLAILGSTPPAEREHQCAEALRVVQSRMHFRNIQPLALPTLAGARR
jgi:hypothetical protein